MYKVLEVSPTAKCSPGVSTVPGINSHGRIHYRPQVGYHNNYVNMLDFIREKSVQEIQGMYLLLTIV